MARLFDRNIFIMLLAIMIGFITITYFVADVVNQSKIDNLTTAHITEMESIEKMNINFTNKYDAPRLPTVDTWTYIKGLVTLRRAVEITLDVSWIDYSWWDHVKDEDNVNFKIVIGGGTTGVTEYTFNIDSLRMLEFPRGYDPAKAIGGTVTFAADHPTVEVSHA